MPTNPNARDTEPLPPFKRIEPDKGVPSEWEVCRDNPAFEVNRKGQLRTREHQPEVPAVGTPWPFPLGKAAPTESPLDAGIPCLVDPGYFDKLAVWMSDWKRIYE